VQNPRRAVYEAFDPQLQNLQAFIVGAAQDKGLNARNLEAAVAWLLWMLGFGVAHLGATPRMQDAADLIATTPGGHFVIVECTTGLLKAENKLALLHARAQTVRRRLDASNNTAMRVLAVIVTSRTRNDVSSELEAAERLGALVIAREDLERAINIQTSAQTNADQIFINGEKQVSAALAKYQVKKAG
jgi:hypothetical protein